MCEATTKMRFQQEFFGTYWHLHGDKKRITIRIFGNTLGKSGITSSTGIKSRTKNWFRICSFGTYCHRRGDKKQSPIHIFGDTKKKKLISNQEQQNAFSAMLGRARMCMWISKNFMEFFSIIFFLHVFGYACESACVHADF